jgi:AAA domain
MSADLFPVLCEHGVIAETCRPCFASAGTPGDRSSPQVSPIEATPDLRKQPNRDTGDTSTLPARRTSWTAAELMATDFPEPRWAVPGIVAEGVNLFAGPPKVGKSWLSLGLGLSVATGGKALGSIVVDQGPALYLALEDTPRRLKTRLAKMLGPEPPPTTLRIAVSCPPLPQGGDQRIADWLDRNPDARLVAIDVLARVRGPISREVSLYDADYAAVARAKALADQYGVAILLVHHTRKLAAADFLDEVSGSHGLSGAADAVLALKRLRGQADGILSITGRDIEEAEHALTFAADIGAWQLLDTPAAEIRMGESRLAVLTYVREHEGARPRQISDGLKLDYELTKKTCVRMVKDGQLDTDGRGRHFAPYTGDSAGVPGVPGVPVAGQSTFPQGHPDEEVSLLASNQEA